MARKKSTYARRLGRAVIPCLLLSFMACVWGPMEVFVGNTSNFRFTYMEALLPLGALCLACTAVLALLVSLLRRRVFALVLSVITALCVAGYAQNMFLNLDLGLLEGEAIDWASFGNHGAVNLAIWAAIIAVVVTVLMLLKKRTSRICRLVCALLLLVQGVTFATVSVQHLMDEDQSTQGEYVLSGEEQYNVSAEGNVIVFMLDYFSNDYIDAMVKQYPDALDNLKDFTYYDNCDPTYIGTFPSVVHMLTGHAFDNTVTIDQWFNDAWNSESAQYFYQALKDNGYTFNFFDSTNMYFGMKYAEPYVNNLVYEEAMYTLKPGMLLKCMLKLSAYRYLPHTFKQYFVQSNYDFARAATLTGAVQRSNNRGMFYDALKKQKLSVVENDGKYFIIEFLRGTHPPYDVGEKGYYDADATLEECARGYFRMIDEYIAQLKSLGLYDDATIIITSDHGDKENSMQVMYFIKEANVTREKMAETSAPISHKDFIGTVLHNIGVEYPYGQSIYDFGDKDERERTVMRNYIDTNYPKVPKYQSNVDGTHTVMYAYTYEGDRKDLRKEIKRDRKTILPLTESFN